MNSLVLRDAYIIFFSKFLGWDYQPLMSIFAFFCFLDILSLFFFLNMDWQRIIKTSTNWFTPWRVLIASDKPDWMQDPVIGRGKNNNNNNRNADINRNAGSETEQTGKNHIVCLYNHSVMYASLNKKKMLRTKFLEMAFPLHCASICPYKWRCTQIFQRLDHNTTIKAGEHFFVVP